MAKANIPELEPTAMYRIKVNRQVAVHDGTTIFRPSMLEIVVTGEIAAQIGDALESAERV